MAFSQIHQDLPDILRWAQTHPLEDRIHFYSRSETQSSQPIWSGSSGLHYVATLLDQITPTKMKQALSQSTGLTLVSSFRPMWRPTDTDIYQLGCADNQVKSDQETAIDQVDVVFKTVEELLLNFDLACCRAAYDTSRNVWVSAQCLLAITTGDYPVVTSTLDRKKFMAAFLATQQYEGKSYRTNIAEKLFDRYTRRLKKYEERGYSAVLIEAETSFPWLEYSFSKMA